MGALFSYIASNVGEIGYTALSRSQSSKRQRMITICNEESSRLIPCLPDEVSIRILARLPRMSHYNARSVSRRWKAAFMSPELYSVRKELQITEEWLYVMAKADSAAELTWFALDPLSNKWLKLPQMPPIAFDEPSPNGSSSLSLWNLVAPTIRVLLRRSEAGRELPLYGCSIGAVDGSLYVLGGFSKSSTMSRVWRYDPVMNEWSEVNPMSTGRAYGKIAILNNKLYVVGGVKRGHGRFIPLQSAEVYDPASGDWSQVPSMPFSKARVQPTTSLADMLKPIATGMTSYMGKLCVPQSLYSWPFIVDAGGEMYDPETDSWVEMPSGMGEEWPARQAGTKLSIVVDGELYALDPSGSSDSGKIKVYDRKEDVWKVAISKVPISDVADSESPYLLAGLLGKLHVVAKDANSDEISVLQAEPLSKVESPSSSSSFFSEPLEEYLDSRSESDSVVWKNVSSKSFGGSELLGCVVIDL